MAFSPDGKRIVSGSDDNTVKVWDARTGQEVLTLKGHTDGVISVAFSPDGKRIAQRQLRQDGEGVGRRTRARRLLTLKGHTDYVTSVAFSPDGKRIVSGSRDKTVKVWDAADGPGDSSPSRDTPASVSSVAFSPDGKRLVSGSWDKTVKVWDAATGQELLTLKGHTSACLQRGVQPRRQTPRQRQWRFPKLTGR